MNVYISKIVRIREYTIGSQSFPLNAIFLNDHLAGWKFPRKKTFLDLIKFLSYPYK